MTVGPLIAEICCTFLLAAFLLNRYGSFARHHLLVTINVFIAWYFSFIVIFILPLDVSTTAYRQCLSESSDNGTNDTEGRKCMVPWSHVPEGVLPSLWRVVYWTSQALTWIILPLMQSYSTAGDFTVAGKLKTALVENAIYYGTYLLIFGVLLVYVATKPDINLDAGKLKVICITASNTWGLFLLVLLLGYGLVEIPRNCWNKGKRGYMLSYLYFKAAKLSMEKCEAEEKLDDILEEVHHVSLAISRNHPLRPHVDTILKKCPDEKRLSERANRRVSSENLSGVAVTERNLVRLHQQVIRALQMTGRTTCQWNTLVKEVFYWEDVARNEMNVDRQFKSTFFLENPGFFKSLCTPSIEWYWKCLVRGWVLRTLAVILGMLSAAVVWSEITFFVRSPILTLFGLFHRSAEKNYDYVGIEVMSILTIAYLCVCAYYTIFRIRVLNYYYLASHHQTDEYSLIFSGMLLCRLTPPLCLNFLGLIHLDTHVTSYKRLETAYTQIMGHMDVISIISDGFNIYFPMLIFVLCLATYFHLGSRLLHLVGFEQFLGDDEMTSDLIDEGRELIRREKGRRQRAEGGEARRKHHSNKLASSRKSEPAMVKSASDESARAELLRDVQPVGYTEGVLEELRDTETDLTQAQAYNVDVSQDLFSNEIVANSYQHSWSHWGQPPKGLFDDV